LIVFAVLFVSALAAKVASASGGHHHGAVPFDVQGRITVLLGSCVSNECSFEISSNELNDHKGHILQFTANGEIDQSTCKVEKKKTCCRATGSGSTEDIQGTVDADFAGRACINAKQTKESFHGTLKITGGAGGFLDARGSGEWHAHFDPANGSGSIVLTGTIKPPK
jgi:hypothetical protein